MLVHLWCGESTNSWHMVSVQLVEVKWITKCVCAVDKVPATVLPSLDEKSADILLEYGLIGNLFAFHKNLQCS